MGFAIYAAFHSRAICLWRDMLLHTSSQTRYVKSVSALRAQGRGDLYLRTFHHVRHRRTYRCFATQSNIAIAKQAYRVPKAHIAFDRRRNTLSKE